MRSALSAFVLAAGLSWAAAHAQPPAQPVDAPPSTAQLRQALEQLKTDPNLATVRKHRALKWKFDTDNPDNSQQDWQKWLADAIAWFAGSARALLWVLVVLLAAAVALVVKRYWQTRIEPARPVRFGMPTHVRDLDIRPESLPDDIGAAALASWERGEHRAALSLLYRGTLSRLLHVHQVPIRDSSTEGDCRRLAGAALPAAPAAYVTELIEAWQRAVYGGNDPTDDELRTLCAEFTRIDRAAA